MSIVTNSIKTVVHNSQYYHSLKCFKLSLSPSELFIVPKKKKRIIILIIKTILLQEFV
jgi:hypothetical protein